MAKTKDAVRIKAEQYYIENIEVTQAEVADLYGVRPATIGEWVKKYDWEDKRLNFHASDVGKLMAALDRCETQADPTTVYKVLKELDLFISQQDAEFATQCTKYHKQFLQLKVKNEQEG